MSAVSVFDPKLFMLLFGENAVLDLEKISHGLNEEEQANQELVVAFCDNYIPKLREIICAEGKLLNGAMEGLVEASKSIASKIHKWEENKESAEDNRKSLEELKSEFEDICEGTEELIELMEQASLDKETALKVASRFANIAMSNSNEASLMTDRFMGAIGCEIKLIDLLIHNGDRFAEMISTAYQGVKKSPAVAVLSVEKQGVWELYDGLIELKAIAEKSEDIKEDIRRLVVARGLEMMEEF